MVIRQRGPHRCRLMEEVLYDQAPEIDGVVYIKEGVAEPGTLVNVRITAAREYDLIGVMV